MVNNTTLMDKVSEEVNLPFNEDSTDTDITSTIVHEPSIPSTSYRSLCAQRFRLQGPENALSDPTSRFRKRKKRLRRFPSGPSCQLEERGRSLLARGNLIRIYYSNVHNHDSVTLWEYDQITRQWVDRCQRSYFSC